MCHRTILDVALKTCQEGEKSLVAAACETLAEAFERCPDALLMHLQPHLLELSALAISPQISSTASREVQQLLTALFVAYVQSCADSIARGGRSDALKALFTVSHVAKEARGAGDADAGSHEFAASHAVDAIATVGRALLKAAEDEGASAAGSRAAGVATSAQLQGMIQVYLEGVVGLLPLHQVRPPECHPLCDDGPLGHIYAPHHRGRFRSHARLLYCVAAVGC